MTEKTPSDIPASEFSPYSPPACDSEQSVDWEGYACSGSQIRPWVRFWARTLDYYVFCLLFGGLAVAIHPPLAEFNHLLLGIGLLICHGFFEPLLLTSFGTTPFKALLNVRVRNLDGSKPGYLKGLRRTFSACLRGQGLGIPLVALITHSMACTRLTQKGITVWDEDGGFRVAHQNIPWWKWLIFAASVTGLIWVRSESI
jgi:uncharacterized RDD family membrane protein YckC